MDWAYKFYISFHSMTHRSHSFVRPSLGELSLDMSECSKKQPIMYTNSSTKVDLGELQTEILKSKYQKQYSKFYKSLHQRSKSQVEKLERIIQDASDLNEILNDPNKWLSKRASREQRKVPMDQLTMGESVEVRQIRMKWKNSRKMEL